MIIREAETADTSEIVKVLKASLGENNLPLSEKIWNYKHIENPFGKSIVFVAEENNEIIGVRAFMRWQWQNNNKIFSAFRAVDTATHPDHQGKGIFKKLTLQAVEYAGKNNGDFIFNTPNDKSRPGYLKMGWELTDKIKVVLRPSIWSFFKFSSSSSLRPYQNEINATIEELEDLTKLWNNFHKSLNKFFTPKSQSFLMWRYEQNPLQRYEVYANKDFYLAGYIKKRKNIKELRISECISTGEKETLKDVERIITKWCKSFGIQVVSFSPDIRFNKVLELKGNFGPILTVRELTIGSEEFIKLKNINNWNYSLGDLELF